MPSLSIAQTLRNCSRTREPLTTSLSKTCRTKFRRCLSPTGRQSLMRSSAMMELCNSTSQGWRRKAMEPTSIQSTTCRAATAWVKSTSSGGTESSSSSKTFSSAGTLAWSFLQFHLKRLRIIKKRFLSRKEDTFWTNFCKNCVALLIWPVLRRSKCF